MFGVHMQCIVMPACPQKMLPAANNSLKHVTGRCTLHGCMSSFQRQKTKIGGMSTMAILQDDALHMYPKQNDSCVCL